MYFVLYYLTDIFKKKVSNIKTGRKKIQCIWSTTWDPNFYLFFQENISISRKQFKDSVTELNPFVSPVGLHAIIYEYTWWMDPNNKSALIDAIDKMVGDYQFTCPVQEFAQRYGKKRLWLSQNLAKKTHEIISYIPYWWFNFSCTLCVLKNPNNFLYFSRYAETFNDVYLYYFEHRASNNPWPSWTGVLHGDEIDYIFGTPLNDTFGFNDKEKQLSRDMMTYWANFARTG